MMVGSIRATTSITAHHLFDRGSSCKDGTRCRVVLPIFTGSGLLCFHGSGLMARPGRRWVVYSAITTKEAYSYREDRIPHNLDYEDRSYRNRRLWPPVDNPSLHNPLLRLERMGCGWLGVIFEWEGVVVDDEPNLEKQAWLALSQEEGFKKSQEEGKPPPPAFILRRIEGMKSEQAVSEVLCWSRDPSEARRMASRKEEIHRSLRGGGFYQMRSGSLDFLSILISHNIPIEVASTRPRKSIENAIEAVRAPGFFQCGCCSGGRAPGEADSEMFVYASQLINFIPERCIVFVNSNSSVEAAHGAQMKCVGVAGKHPVYELSAADGPCGETAG